MFFDEEKEYEVTYREKGKVKEGVITLTLEEYEDSFITDQYHLSQNYCDYMVDAAVKDDKMTFIEDKIKETYGDVKVNKSEIKSIMKEIDQDYEEYLENGEE